MKSETFYIVGIGASAGGMEVLEQFFDSLDNATRMAFVVIRHMPHNHHTQLDEIILRHTSIPIEVVYENCILQPNHIYIIPGACHAAVNENTLVVSPRPISILNRSIDHFFYSLAQEHKNNAIAIIFSGLGSDGAEGCKAIHANGGKVFVQAPDSATYPSMPRSVAYTDEPEVLLPGQIAQRLNLLAEQNQSASFS